MQRLRFQSLTGCLALVAILVTMPAGADPAPNNPAGGPFADVPKSYPAYTAVQYLSAEFRVFTGYPEGAFSGARALTRYEFAVAVQRMAAGSQQTIIRLQEGKAGVRPVVFRGPPGTPDPEGERTLEAWKDPRKRERALAWLLVLVTEFRPELKMLGTDIAATQENLLRWQDEARKAAEQAEKK